MLLPPDYLAAALAQQEATRLRDGGAPLATDAPDTLLVPRATAEAAVALALADAEQELERLERYHRLLQKAFRSATPINALEHAHL